MCQIEKKEGGITGIQLLLLLIANDFQYWGNVLLMWPSVHILVFIKHLLFLSVQVNPILSHSSLSSLHNPMKNDCGKKYTMKCLRYVPQLNLHAEQKQFSCEFFCSNRLCAIYINSYCPWNYKFCLILPGLYTNITSYNCFHLYRTTIDLKFKHCVLFIPLNSILFNRRNRHWSKILN